MKMAAENSGQLRRFVTSYVEAATFQWTVACECRDDQLPAWLQSKTYLFHIAGALFGA
jgi:hypothetical protein